MALVRTTISVVSLKAPVVYASFDHDSSGPPCWHLLPAPESYSSRDLVLFEVPSWTSLLLSSDSLLGRMIRSGELFSFDFIPDLRPGFIETCSISQFDFWSSSLEGLAHPNHTGFLISNFALRSLNHLGCKRIGDLLTFDLGRLSKSDEALALELCSVFIA